MSIRCFCSVLNLKGAEKCKGVANGLRYWQVCLDTLRVDNQAGVDNAWEQEKLEARIYSDDVFLVNPQSYAGVFTPADEDDRIFSCSSSNLQCIHTSLS